MSDITISNNDYAKALYSKSMLSDSEVVSSLQDSSALANAEKSRGAQRAAPGKTAADVAESHELGVLPQQGSLSLQDAALYKSMADSLPNNLDFDMSAIMQAIFKSMLSMLRTQSASRMADLTMMGTAYKQAADQMRAGAAMELTGSVLSSGMQLVGAGLSMSGTVYSAKTSGLEYAQTMKPFTVGNEMLNSSGSVLKGGMDFAGKTEDADATLSKAAATHAQALRENEDELYKEVSKFIDQMMQIIESIQNQQHAASAQILSA